MKREKQNPIALRSQKWITDALFKLMEEKDFNEITITDISREADLVRQTFYKNFDSKEQVLIKYMETLSDQLIEKCKDTDRMLVKELAILNLEFWFERADLLRLLIKHNLLDLINICYKKFIFEYTDDYFRQNSAITKYSIDFVIGGIVKCIKEWVGDDFSISIDELANIMLSVINSDFFMTETP